MESKLFEVILLLLFFGNLALVSPDQSKNATEPQKSETTLPPTMGATTTTPTKTAGISREVKTLDPKNLSNSTGTEIKGINQPVTPKSQDVPSSVAPKVIDHESANASAAPENATAAPNNVDHSVTAKPEGTTHAENKVETSRTSPTTSSTTSTTTEQSVVKPKVQEMEKDRGFDGPSFIGGIVLAMGLTGIGFVAYKFCKSRTDRNYRNF